MLRLALAAAARRAAPASASLLPPTAAAAAAASCSGRTFSSSGVHGAPSSRGPPKFTLPLSSHPASLAWPDAPAAADPGAGATGLRRALLRLGGAYSRDTAIARGGRALYVAAADAATAPALVAALGLRPSVFADEHALLCLHVWMLLVRLRPEGPDGKDTAQALYENFSDDVEARVRAAGVRVRVSKWLAELEKQFYGGATAYDKAMGRRGGEEGGVLPPPAAGASSSRAALADALLRNVYAGDDANRGLAGEAADYVLR
jgi:cytochrome b pre-mRNA-processing protein 3